MSDPAVSPVGILPPNRGVEAALAAARSRYRVCDPASAGRALAEGALVIDIRPVAQRLATGVIPGSLAIERNVLEWRLDPSSEARIVEANSWSRRIVLYCQEGYASSLAVAGLLDLGLTAVTDIGGGIRAWIDQGRPVAPPQ